MGGRVWGRFAGEAMREEDSEKKQRKIGKCNGKDSRHMR
jgi:hypothetical protein